MIIEAAIYERWKELPDLLAVLPLEKVATGDWQDETSEPTFPYATLNIEGTVNDSYTSNGRTDESLLRIQVWHETRAVADAIAEKLVESFDNQHFTRLGIEVEKVRKENVIPIQEEDGAWQFLVQFIVTHRKAT